MVDTLHLALVDENPDDRALIIRELRRAFPALEVVQIIDNASLAKALAEGTYDLVITEYRLHWTTGFGILQMVKKTDPACPVIMLTGIGSADIAVAAMKAGVDDYVLKSHQSLTRLPAAVQAALAKAQHDRAGQTAAGSNPAGRDRMPLRDEGTTAGEWLVDVAQEIDHLLAIILGCATTLCQSLASSPGAEQAEKIFQAAEQCMQIIGDGLAAARQESSERPPIQGKQMAERERILVVDDEPGIAEVLAEVLRLDGHVVEMVGNGEAALEKLATGQYDLILSDVRMPDLDGLALYRKVERCYPALVPFFIFLTGDIMSPEISQLLAHIAAPCLSKPFTLNDVREIVQRVLQTESSQQ